MTAPDRPAATSGELPAGELLGGRFRILGLLGSGGMGQVYAAHDERLDRRVAVKTLPKSLQFDEQRLARFETEARATSALHHPNVLTIHDVGVHQGVPFLITELLEGETLRSALAAPLPPTRAARLASDLARGLEAVHEHGIVHRDLKPENVFLSADGTVKILDFGIAKLVDGQQRQGSTETGVLLGTANYMSPEQVRGEPADARADIFSFGALLYEMLSGRRAFEEATSVETGYSILNREPRPLPDAIPERLTVIVRRCLTKDPAGRYKSARELRLALDEAITAPLPALPRRSRLAVAGIAAAAVAIAAAVVAIGIWRARRHPPPQSRRSVAVLGFRNLSSRADAAWLSTALAEMFGSELAAGGKLRTLPGESVSRLKSDLALGEADSFALDTLERIRRALGADDVLAGSYLALPGGKLRIDLRLQDTASGEAVATVTENGTEAELIDLVSRVGARLRAQLGAPALTADETAGVRASLPENGEAARLYAEGLDRLRRFDAQGAGEALRKAIGLEPAFPLAHSALSQALADLGYDDQSVQEAKAAFDHSGALSREERLVIEGRYREATHDWAKAIDIYQALLRFYPDNVEYGLLLATAQVDSDDLKAALQTVAAMRKIAPADPRLDLVEGRAEQDSARSDAVFQRAIEHAQAQGSGLLLARALNYRAWTLLFLGRLGEAAAAAQKSRELFAAAGDQRGEAMALNALGPFDMAAGKYHAALRSFGEAAEIARRIGARSALLPAIMDEVFTYLSMGEPLAAAPMIDEMKAVARELNSSRWLSDVQSHWAWLKERSGDLDGALRLYEEAARLSSDPGSVDFGRARLRLDADDPRGARELLQQAVDRRRRSGESAWLPDLYTWMARVELERGDLRAAEEQARQAISIAHGMSPGDEGYAEATFARVLAAQGRQADALAAAGRAEPIVGEWRDARLTLAIAHCEIDAPPGHRTELEQDAQRLAGILAEAEKAGCVDQRFEAALALGMTEIRLGRVRAGRARLAALAKEARAKGFLLVARKASKR